MMRSAGLKPRCRGFECHSKLRLWWEEFGVVARGVDRGLRLFLRRGSLEVSTTFSGEESGSVGSLDQDFFKQRY